MRKTILAAIITCLMITGCPKIDSPTNTDLTSDVSKEACALARLEAGQLGPEVQVACELLQSPAVWQRILHLFSEKRAFSRKLADAGVSDAK